MNLCYAPIRFCGNTHAAWSRVNTGLNKKLFTWPGEIKERAREERKKNLGFPVLLRALVFCPLEFPGSFLPRPAICLVLQLCDRLFLDYGVTRYPIVISTWYTRPLFDWKTNIFLRFVNIPISMYLWAYRETIISSLHHFKLHNVRVLYDYNQWLTRKGYEGLKRTKA